MSGKEYFNSGEGLLLKHQGGKTIQENTLLKYEFKADIKKTTSPRYVAFNGNVNGRLQVDKHNQNSAFLIYVEHDGYDIRLQFSYELMSLILEIRNSFYDAEPVRNPFYDIGRSSLEFKRLSYTPKLVEMLTTKRIKLDEDKREQIILKNAKEILDLKNKHQEGLIELLMREEARNKLENEE